MKFGKYPVGSVFMLLLFGAKYVMNHFFPEKSAAFDPTFTGILEIAIVVFVIYYVRLLVTWAYNYRKAA